MRLSAGDTPLPGYRLDALLGRGIYGERWKATGPGGTQVSLKFIPLAADRGVQQAQMIERLAQLRHAHLESIQAVWMLDADGNPLSEIADSNTFQTPNIASVVVASPLADRNLADRLAEYQQSGAFGIPAGELLQHLEDAARAVDFLARRRFDLSGDSEASQPLVGHGGIRPQNILLLSDSAVVSDYGLAAVLGNRCSATMSSGALAYLAPERMQGEAAQSASDQYALAVCYAELRTGDAPLTEESTFAGAMSQQQEGRLDLSGLPDAERSVIARATLPSPGERFGSCLEMVRALQEVVQDASADKRLPAVDLSPAGAAPARASVIPTPPVSSPAATVSVAPVEQEAGSIWLPLFIAACVGFAIYATAQISSLRKMRDEVSNHSRLIVANSRAIDEVADTTPNATGAEQSPGATGSALAADGKDAGDASSAAEEPEHNQSVPPKPESALAENESQQKSEGSAASKDVDPNAIAHQARKIPLDEVNLIEVPREETDDAKAPVVENAVVEKPAQDDGEQSDDKAMAEPAESFSRKDIPADVLALAGDGVAADAPGSLVAVFGEGDEIDTAQIVSAAQSQDGRLLATSTKNHHVRVWNVSDRSVLYDLSGHDGPVYSMAFSSDGQMLATGGTADHEVRLWRVSDGSEMFLLSGHGGWVTSLAFSPDGSLLATAGTDGNVMLWETETGRLSRLIDGPEGRTVHSLAFSPNGASLVIAGKDKRIRICEVATGLTLRTLLGHSQAVRSVAFSADGKKLASASEDKTVRLWDLESSADPITAEHHGDWVRCVAFSRDSSRLASCGYDGKINIYDAVTGDLRETLQIKPPGKQIVKIMFSKTGRFLTCANGNGTVYVLRLEQE